MKQDLEKIKEDALEQLAQLHTGEELQHFRVEFLGRKEGKLTLLMKGLKGLSIEEKKEIGPLANEIRNSIESLITKKEKELEQASVLDESEAIDTTLEMQGEKKLGTLHPIIQIQQEVEDHLLSMGFMVADGPEMESDYFNFGALNFPKEHPARDAMDTFWVDQKKGVLMRAHTSATQARTLEKYGAPLKAIVPGRCFRNEDIDATHEHTFYQIEGLMVDENLSIANLIAVMKEILRGVFKKEVNVRLRPGYFPFVEPGFELDIEWTNAKGQTKWLELLPCGMIHPNVLKAAGIDTNKYNGFAFALGLDRAVMMRYGIDDIRHFHRNDIRFLKQF